MDKKKKKKKSDEKIITPTVILKLKVLHMSCTERS